jgi:hypothetical protein
MISPRWAISEGLISPGFEIPCLGYRPLLAVTRQGYAATAADTDSTPGKRATTDSNRAHPSLVESRYAGKKKKKNCGVRRGAVERDLCGDSFILLGRLEHETTDDEMGCCRARSLIILPSLQQQATPEVRAPRFRLRFCSIAICRRPATIISFWPRNYRLARLGRGVDRLLGLALFATR